MLSSLANIHPTAAGVLTVLLLDFTVIGIGIVAGVAYKRWRSLKRRQR